MSGLSKSLPLKGKVARVSGSDEVEARHEIYLFFPRFSTSERFATPSAAVTRINVDSSYNLGFARASFPSKGKPFGILFLYFLSSK